jgi:hypothetical protein
MIHKLTAWLFGMNGDECDIRQSTPISDHSTDSSTPNPNITIAFETYHIGAEAVPPSTIHFRASNSTTKVHGEA